jgi:multidrug resistance efflux pump
MREHSEPGPRDDKDATQDTARDLAEIASHIAQLKGDYKTLKLRLEAAHSAVEAAAVEARRRVRLNGGR